MPLLRRCQVYQIQLGDQHVLITDYEAGAVLRGGRPEPEPDILVASHDHAAIRAATARRPGGFSGSLGYRKPDAYVSVVPRLR